jgi:hypothetical protein
LSIALGRIGRRSTTAERKCRPRALADTGILDYFFERYIEDSRRRPMPLLEWVDTVYDPVELKRTFRTKGWANRLIDQALCRE